ncbi:MAG: FAD-dependent oxidoreductase [Alphaproteobacteria bacterium]|jgi:pyruvate/2-oxoglutarate dehydrogenase complex dihydrolipoamide dehydrogenase (E3) component|nr:FAD-dependent oxidoreductase [Alphaproteobacteria bacterium]MBT4084538.1 FAD-dependent oxidoreductase [Alphaproteobacteria bacterium]MBT4545408.1 FAD-dependent oxidoreductase [Alphaproteobacteria bacterium]MBT7748156.1 FAD-dependent oxidoreductase [Alphaproteobacteria bacterium]
MTERIETDICVIGGGSAGLVVSAGASQMGADTVLIEKGLMGGDCLNYGCVPSKALIAAGRAAADARAADKFGVSASVDVDFARVQAHVKDVIDGIAPHDSVVRFEGLGVKVVQATAEFVSPGEVVAGDLRIKARRFVIATGSSPLVPPIPGLDQTSWFTNETIFENTTCPDHLVIIGGGPIGMELAQAHRNLGARVSVIEMFTALGADDPELARVVADCLQRDGIELHENTRVTGVEAAGAGVAVLAEHNGEPLRIEGSHLLIAAGRKPNTDSLGLETAGVKSGPKGIEVDAGLRTSNRKIYAIGDVTGGLQFTHMAGFEAGIVLRSALFRLPAKAKTDAAPWVTYTEPELAQVGLNEARARAVHGEIRILRWPFSENDRARSERDEDGLVKIITTKSGHILGAGIVGKNAGDLIQPWTLAIQKKMKIGAMAGVIAPYPTRGEASKRAAGSFYTKSLFSERTRKIVRFLGKFG